MRLVAIAVVLSLSATLGGCAAKSGSKDGKTGSKGPGIHQTCVQTWCDECTSSSDAECNDCLDTCDTVDYDFMAECLSTCDDICSSPTDCSSECQDNSCYQTGFELTLPDKSDAKLKQACQADAQRMSGCNFIVPDCDAVSRAIMPRDASSFTCDIGKSCNDPCPDVAPPTTLGDDICKACNDDTQCTPDMKALFNAIDGVLVPSMHDALHQCLDQSSCSDTWDCVDTFFDTLYPGFKDAVTN